MLLHSRKRLGPSASIIPFLDQMKFNIYGRFQVEVRRTNDLWIVYRTELGKRTELNDVVIPADLDASEIAIYLDDIFHEFAGRGQCVELMDP